MDNLPDFIHWVSFNRKIIWIDSYRGEAILNILYSAEIFVDGSLTSINSGK